MPRLRANDRLPPQDAIFLYLENQQMPLHIGSVSIFEGDIALSECLDLVRSKLPLLPRYQQRIVTPPWNVGHPTWEYDPDFDVQRHVNYLALKHGTQTELREIAGKVLSQLMDRDRPLWDITLVGGLLGGRTALIGRVHHCLADGLTGSAILSVILDPSPTGPPHAERKKKSRAPRLPDSGTSLVNALLTFWPEMAAQFLSAQAEAVAIGEKLAGEREPLKLRESAPFLPELLAPTERLPFNRPCSGPRKVAWTEIPMVEAKAIKAACGGTLNDFVLTLLTSAVRRYAKLHGVALKNRRLRVMVPVSLRREGDNGQLGNRVSMIPISIPLDVRDPVTLLRTIHRRSEWLKRGHIADFVKLVSTWMGVVPAPLQAAFGALAMPVPPFNMVCTNVPGPQAPMYLLGHRMLTSYPYVPIGNDMGLNCAVQSYNGTLYFGLTGDAVAVPDLARLNGFLQSSLLELRDATGISMLEKTAQPEAAPVPHSEAASFLGERLGTSLPAPPNYAPPPATNAAAKITAA